MCRINQKDEEYTSLLCEIQQTILKNNFVKVKIGGIWYVLVQKQGAITGFPHSVIEADIYLAAYEFLKLIQPNPNVLIDARYVDDRIKIIVGSEEEAKNHILQAQNTYGEEIKVTTEYSCKGANILDLHISPSKREGRLFDFSPYFKPLKTTGISLHPESDRPIKDLKTVVKGQVDRLLRLSSERHLHENAKKRFFNLLFKQGWDRKLVMSTKISTWEDRPELLRRKSKQAKFEKNHFYFSFSYSSEPALKRREAEIQKAISDFSPEGVSITLTKKAGTRLSSLFKR